jgi:1-acyl-sn-glycerol-3-phosphate acyltransferase
MGDLYYTTVVTFGRFPFWVSSVPLVLGRENVPRTGPFILASNHLSPFDVPVLMRSTPRRLDFVSVVEVFRNPLVAWFYSQMNAFPLDRHRADPKTVRIILDRLERGRPVAMFPEGRIRKYEESVIHGAPFRPGVARVASMANVPIVPAVVLNSIAYARPAGWLPLRRTRYGVVFGQPINVRDEAHAEQQLADAFQTLAADLAQRARDTGMKFE